MESTQARECRVAATLLRSNDAPAGTGEGLSCSTESFRISCSTIGELSDGHQSSECWAAETGVFESCGIHTFGCGIREYGFDIGVNVGVTRNLVRVAIATEVPTVRQLGVEAEFLEVILHGHTEAETSRDNLCIDFKSHQCVVDSDTTTNGHQWVENISVFSASGLNEAGHFGCTCGVSSCNTSHLNAETFKYGLGQHVEGNLT